MIGHVYVHAPFCARRCVYCDFAVAVDRSPAAEPWLAAIGREFETVRASGAAPLQPEVDTLYVGGGTPSLLDPRVVGRLPAALGFHRLPATLEWTVEANPESFTDAVAREWAAAGVNRVSFGVQSFDPGALEWMGRLHSPSDVAASVARARAAGVRNVSVDLIFGLPDTVSRSWEADLRRALDLAPPHVSLYGLSVETGARLFRDVESGRTPRPSSARYREEYLAAAELFVAAGYEHYEVSNFALPGFASRHNSAYWTGASYLGLGNGAHSFHDGRRWWNEREWEAYQALVAQSGHGRAGEERPSPDQTRLESLWLGLRTARGLDLVALEATDADRRTAVGVPPRGGLRKAVDSPPKGGRGKAVDGRPVGSRREAVDRLVRGWAARGLAVRDGTTVRLTPSGWLALDDLTVELDLAWGTDPPTPPRTSDGPRPPTPPRTTDGPNLPTPQQLADAPGPVDASAHNAIIQS